MDVSLCSTNYPRLIKITWLNAPFDGFMIDDCIWITALAVLYDNLRWELVPQHNSEGVCEREGCSRPLRLYLAFNVNPGWVGHRWTVETHSCSHLVLWMRLRWLLVMVEKDARLLRQSAFYFQAPISHVIWNAFAWCFKFFNCVVTCCTYFQPQIISFIPVQTV